MSKSKQEKKRTTLHVEQAIYELIDFQRKREDQSIQAYVNMICNEIITGKYDNLIEHKKKNKSIAVYQEEIQKVKKYLKEHNAGNNVTEMIKKIILERSLE